jgi:UDP-N-acetylglucosamine--N-acetylmuramyl-(pentapeptide) pyrophosphoryl-undecaprenol N-acetylglucosamine transferase
VSGRCFFFAGGGTGGHIYPAMAVAERIKKLEPEARIHFFCSARDVDDRILAPTGFEYTRLPAVGFSTRPTRLLGFCSSLRRSYKIATQAIAESESAVVIGVAGYVAGPVCWAAHKLGARVVLLNVDTLPGLASKLIARWADRIFVQFEETAEYFGKNKAKVEVVGCPLRSRFDNPEPGKAVNQIGLNDSKKTLLITGASSGAQNINRAVCSLLEKLIAFAEDWQIVHLTGYANFEEVRQKYAGVMIRHKVLPYYDDMPSLLAVADLLIGRSGAVSVAEYAAAGVPSICMPYPYHKDRHQYLNAGKLVEAGAAIIVDDLPDENDRAEWLWEELQELMKNDQKRKEMSQAGKSLARLDAAHKIAAQLVEMAKL